jgi:hypothetical protein
MNTVCTLMLGAAVLTACSSAMDNANRESRALNAQARAEAAASARNVQIGGRTFQVTMLRNGGYTTRATDTSLTNFVVQRDGNPYALVRRIAPATAPYTSEDVVIAAQSVSGCAAQFNAGVLQFVGGFSAGTADLGALEAKITSGFNGWRTDLTC